MLVLTRKENEQIRIGDAIEITVVEVRGDRVKLGIACPIEIPVHRREVYDRIQGESTGHLGRRAVPEHASDEPKHPLPDLNSHAG